MDSTSSELKEEEEEEEEESPADKEAREKFEAGQALLNSSRGDKPQVSRGGNTVAECLEERGRG